MVAAGRAHAVLRIPTAANRARSADDAPVRGQSRWARLAADRLRGPTRVRAAIWLLRPRLPGVWPHGAGTVTRQRYHDSTVVDFVVVGSGVAGGVIARELAIGGFSTVVLEQGPRL